MIVERETNPNNFSCIACTNQRELYEKIAAEIAAGNINNLKFYTIRFGDGGTRSVIRLCHQHAHALGTELIDKVYD